MQGNKRDLAKESRKIFLDQTMSYLRECHGHLMTLTGRVLALNLAGLAAFGFLVRADLKQMTVVQQMSPLLLYSFGGLVIFFGVVFNAGASASQKHLLKTQSILQKFIGNQVEKFDPALMENESYKELKEFTDYQKSGQVARLTDVYLLICCLIWVLLGITISNLGYWAASN